MARVYYHEEKLCGVAIETEAINLSVFDYIVNNCNANQLEIPKSFDSLLGFIKTETPQFRHVYIWNDGIP